MITIFILLGDKSFSKLESPILPVVRRDPRQAMVLPKTSQDIESCRALRSRKPRNSLTGGAVHSREQKHSSPPT